MGPRLRGHWVPLIGGRRVIWRRPAIARLLAFPPRLGIAALIASIIRRRVLRRRGIIRIAFLVTPILASGALALGDPRPLHRALRARDGLLGRLGRIVRRRARRLIGRRGLFDRARRGRIVRGLGLGGGFGGWGGCDFT